MSESKSITESIRTLNILGNIWLVLVGILFVLGIAGAHLGVDLLSRGAVELTWMLRSFNVTLLVFIVLTIAPGLLLKLWASRIRRKSLSKIEVIYG